MPSTSRPRSYSQSSVASCSSMPSPCSSLSSLDEEELNARLTPHWPSYRSLLESRGFRLDTFRDVREFYRKYLEDQGCDALACGLGYSRACRGCDNDDDLCKDAGLPDSLFRGTRISDGTKIVVKAVQLRSREYDVIGCLSTSPLREDPMNHCIPVLDLIPFPCDDIGFIVMEEWASQLLPATPCSLGGFLQALRQCIEHTAFMHTHHMAHLDISLRNLLTDYQGQYACIDYELSRRFDVEDEDAGYVQKISQDCMAAVRRVRGCKGTEIPPELEQGDSSDAYKVDVWALGVLILRACKLTGYDVPELDVVTRAMLNDDPNKRPYIAEVLRSFNDICAQIDGARLQTCSPLSGHE